MLQLKNIVKTYQTGTFVQKALDGVSLNFRENEFVSVLGQSGSGKTTLLNIIGGLDRYNSGDLIINGTSTKKYKDKDWDTYRNHSIGFIFQSYNLIPHQTVLANVELALTLSGISKKERRKRAREVLERVGLGDQLHKRPNQMSGGQMQRVAIARALINNPDILLADEPTGALDSDTSLQIMELLMEISRDKLIIMVTHNPDLAEQYSNRIIKLKDGCVIDDSNPYTYEDVAEDIAQLKKAESSAKRKHTSMSFFTALSLSFNNLLTKKARTFMTSFAGSIGIIGIALILSLSHGFQSYIDSVQEDALTSYPITIAEQTMDMATVMTSMQSTMQENAELEKEADRIYSKDIMTDMLEIMTAQVQTNNLEAFRAYLEKTREDEDGIYANASAVSYSYSVPLQLYRADTTNGVFRVNPSDAFEGFGGGSGDSMTSALMTANTWQRLLGNDELLASQYEVLAGHWPQAYNEVIIIVDKNNEISDFTLYSLGLKDAKELTDMMRAIMSGKEYTSTSKNMSFSYDELLSLTYKLVPVTDTYREDNGIWKDISEDEILMKQVVDKAEEIRVVGIVKATSESAALMSGAVGYTNALIDHLIEVTNNSAVAKAQTKAPDTDIFTGKPFESDENQAPPFDPSTLSPEQQQYLASLSEEERAALLASYTTTSSATYEGNLSLLGVVDPAKPSAINIYPKNFEAKERICDLIDTYNNEYKANQEEEYVISYSDIMGVMMSSITTIINTISYVLIAFVSISLVVSSIMIGIITYISVLERTKEIGVLRSIGASKKDISRVFNAETLIVGFASGMIGILTTLLLCIPANMIIYALTDISGLAKLPTVGGIALVIISMILTLISGLVPARIAAKKDPVVALRTE